MNAVSGRHNVKHSFALSLHFLLALKCGKYESEGNTSSLGGFYPADVIQIQLVCPVPCVLMLGMVPE